MSVRVAGVVADDERDLVVVGVVVADQVGDEDARHAFDGTAQDADTDQLPQSIRPVVVSVRQGGWICGQRHRRLDGRASGGRRCPGSSRAGRCRCGTSVDGVLILNEIGLADVDAHLGGEALDRGVARARVPLRLRRAREAVLARDRVDVRASTGRSAAAAAPAGIRRGREPRSRGPPRPGPSALRSSRPCSRSSGQIPSVRSPSDRCTASVYEPSRIDTRQRP